MRKPIKALAMIAMAVCMLSALASCPAGASLSVTVISKSVELAPGQHAVVLHFRALEGCSIAMSLNMSSGNSVDLLLFDEAGYHSYMAGSDASRYLPGSLINQTSGMGASTALEEGQEYYVVADNTNLPSDGAMPKGQVQVDCALYPDSYEVIEDEGMAWGLILVVAALATLAMVIAFFFIRSRRGNALKEPGTSSLEMRHCPGCGAPMAMYDHTCPKCGRKS